MAAPGPVGGRRYPIVAEVPQVTEPAATALGALLAPVKAATTANAAIASARLRTFFMGLLLGGLRDSLPSPYRKQRRSVLQSGACLLPGSQSSAPGSPASPSRS